MRIDAIQPGMRLAKDVFDPNGNVLIRAGVTITERQIKAFKSWGIQEVAVISDETTYPQEVKDPKAIAEIRQLIEQQFSLSNLDHPMIERLRDLCLKRALGQC